MRSHSDWKYLSNVLCYVGEIKINGHISRKVNPKAFIGEFINVPIAISLNKDNF